MFTALAVAAWLIAVGRRRALRPVPAAAADATARGAAPRVWRSATALLLAGAFAAQAFSYYGVTAWLPTLLVEDLGLSRAAAGAGASLFQIAAVIGALGVPLVVTRLGPLGSFLVVGALWSSVPLGLLLAPSLWPLWEVLGGAAQGGGITIVFVVLVRIARTDGHAARLSATVQGVAYTVAATSPTLIGLVHDATGAWTAPLLVVLAAIVAFTGFGVLASLRGRRPVAG